MRETACFGVHGSGPQSARSRRARSGAVDCLEQCTKQLGRLLEHIRGLVLETVRQKAVAFDSGVEDPAPGSSSIEVPAQIKLLFLFALYYAAAVVP